jgi:hypothetical protein
LNENDQINSIRGRILEDYYAWRNHIQASHPSKSKNPILTTIWSESRATESTRNLSRITPTHPKKEKTSLTASDPRKERQACRRGKRNYAFPVAADEELAAHLGEASIRFGSDGEEREEGRF